MYYSELVKKACNIMFEAHKNDKDKGDYPYVFHPFYIAVQMNDEESVCVALLHDLIEDHSDKYSFDYLIKEGFSNTVINSLRLLTHTKGISYMDYIKAISENPIARKVKIADIKHNLDATRMNGIKSPKYDLYLQALDYLERKNNSTVV